MRGNVAVVVLTLNPGELWRDWIASFNKQEQRPECYVIDSSSDDNTSAIATDHGFNLFAIERASFNHGGTRNYALNLCAEEEDIG